MATKYQIPFFDDYGQQWHVDIDLPSFTGDSTELTGVGRVFCQPEWLGGDDPYDPIINSRVTVQFYNRDGEVDVAELQNLADMEGRMHIYRGADMWWTGYITSDGIQRLMQPMPYTVTINATDGLALFKDIPFTLGNNWPMPAGVNNRCPMSFIRYLLYGFPSYPHLGIVLPIRFQCDVDSVRYGDSAIMGSTGWGALGEAWVDFEGNSRSCDYILRGMISALQCRLVQFGGRWNIIRVNDIVDGVFNWTELSTDTAVAPTVTTGTTDLTAELGVDYQLVNENQVATVKAAYTDVVAEYKHYSAENIIPNGGFERSIFGAPMYWNYSTNPDGRASLELYEDPVTGEKLSLNGRPGQSVIATYPLYTEDPLIQDAEFTFSGGLPLDANILFARFNFGFTFMPINGFPFFTSGDQEGQIDWSNNPLRMRMLYMCDDGTGDSRAYYLNEYGYWQYYPVGGYLDIKSFSAAESGGNTTFTYVFVGNPMIGNLIKIDYTTAFEPFPINHSLSIDSSTAGDLLAAINKIADMIEIDAFWSTAVTQLSTFEVRLVAVVNSTVIEDGGHTVSSGKDSILPGMAIPISVPNMKNGDIANIQFQGRGGNSEVIIPDPGVLDGTQLPTIGKLHMWFYVKEGQQYVLDDVYMRVDDNNDVYQSRIANAAKRTNRKNVELDISSSFSGFMLSNLMTSYDNSNTEFIFTDGKYTGSLTGMTANAAMRYQHKSCEVFEGDIQTSGREWDFNNIYLLGGKKYLPLVSRLNIETGTVTLSAMECRDDENTFVEKHYGSNELILSNT